MKITVLDTEISVQRIGNEDYISLTDMARSQLQELIIFKWLSNKNTIEYVGEWETLYNENFNYTDFGTIKNAAGSNNFILSTKQWILSTNAKGVFAKSGRYGGTFAHRDVVYHFGMWISPRFQLLLLNSVLINDGVPRSERLQKQNHIAISQMTILEFVGENRLQK